MAKYFTGRNDETEAHVLDALRISPRDSNAGIWNDRGVGRGGLWPRRRISYLGELVNRMSEIRKLRRS
jgi:hypothetical protein